MVQSLNPSAIWTLTTAVLRRPSLMIPDYQVATIADIDWQALQQANPTQHRALVFDKDNTLTAPYAREIHESCRASIRQALQVFTAEATAVLSNSAGTASDDPDGADAKAFEQANVDILNGITLPVIRHADKKPSRECLEQVLTHFNNQQQSTATTSSSITSTATTTATTTTDSVTAPTPPLEPQHLVIIGDRLWTDIVFGNLYGCTTIYTAQTLDDSTDNWTAKRIRPIEQRASRFWQRRLGRHPVPPPPPSSPSSPSSST